MTAVPDRRRFITLAAAAAVFAGGLAAARADDAAAAFVQSLGNQAIETLTGPDVTPAIRAERFRALLGQNFDVPAIAKTVLGRYWKVATDAEREEYLKLFEDFLVANYAKRFAEYTGQSFEVRGVRQDGGDLLTVQTIIQTSNGGEPARLDWLLRGGSAYKILDLKIEGISMSETHRAEFASVIQSSGGKVAGLLEALRNKVNTLYPT
jgi:phospholipid transport system substrate-binding protein